MAAKLSVLMGGAIASTGANAAMTPFIKDHVNAKTYTIQGTSLSKPLAAKLMLKQQNNGFKMIAAQS